MVRTVANLEEKAARLREILAAQPGLIVAYSGGVDSAFLAWTAHEVLGERMLAVIADSASLARTHLEDALAFAREQQIPVEVVETRELENPAYARNDAMRCFHCKDELFTVLEHFRAAHGFAAVAYGVNADDQAIFGPGSRRRASITCWRRFWKLASRRRKSANWRGRRVCAYGKSPHRHVFHRASNMGERVTPEALECDRAGRRCLARTGIPAIPRAPSWRNCQDRDRVGMNCPAL